MNPVEAKVILQAIELMLSSDAVVPYGAEFDAAMASLRRLSAQTTT